jgi:sn-glycerol 3-phosphate transport system permease protein
MGIGRAWLRLRTRRAGIAAAPRAPRVLPLGARGRPVNWVPYLILSTGVVVLAFPVYMALLGSTHDPAVIARGDMPLVPGDQMASNYRQAWFLGEGLRVKATPVQVTMLNTLIMALVIATGKIAISILSAFAVAFFRFPLRMFFFWMIFVTLMLPVEVRIIPTFAVVTQLGMINTFQGLTIPLLASATGTLVFRQFFLLVPDELVEAAKIDGAGPMRFFWSILLPISSSTVAALFVIMFVYGWNQYLWPLLITTSSGMETIVISITKMIGNGEAVTDWNIVMATTVLALLPPVLVVILAQRWFIKGLTATEK